MLLYFAVNNYKSFKDEINFFMTALDYKVHKYQCCNIPGNKVLLISSILGNNGSGKSNFINAVKCMRDIVLYNNDGTVKLEGFANNKEPTDFTIIFYSSRTKKLYTYDVAINKGQIDYEYLDISTDGIEEYQCFSTLTGDFQFDGLTEVEAKEILKHKRDNGLLLCAGAEAGIQDFAEVVRCFDDIVCVDGIEMLTNLHVKNYIARYIIKHKTMLNKITEYLTNVDSTVKEIIISKGSMDLPYSRIQIVHDFEGNEYVCQLDKESTGIQRFFLNYIIFRDVLKGGKTLLYDNLDVVMHPILLRNMQQNFYIKENNKKHAQLIFTSNDMVQLNEGYFRKDEIWFVEKNYNGASILFSLSDFKGVDDDIVMCGDDYLRGKFGAIPEIKTNKFK